MTGGTATERSGWWVVAGGSTLLAVQNGLILAAFGAYLVAITADTGWSAGVVALGYAIVQTGNGFIAPITGWCCDRVGTRLVSRIGTLITAVGFGIAALVSDAAHFVAAVVVIALGCSAAGMTPLTIATVQAITRRRTLALGLLPTGIALGGLAVPIVTWALAGMGWRATFGWVAVVTLVVGLTASSVLPTTRRPRPAKENPQPARAEGHGLAEAVRTPAFWLLVIGHGFALVAISAVNLHLVPMMTDQGIPLETAGLAVALMSAAQLFGQILTGVIADRFDKRRYATICMVAQTGVLVAFALASGTMLVVALAFAHGITWGLRGPLMTTLRTEYFGTGSFGTIFGWSSGFVSLGLVSGPLLVTALAEGPGYPFAFWVLAAFTATGTLAFAVLPPARLARRVPRGHRYTGTAQRQGEALPRSDE